jgi:hypothetical protein
MNRLLLIFAIVGVAAVEGFAQQLIPIEELRKRYPEAQYLRVTKADWLMEEPDFGARREQRTAEGDILIALRKQGKFYLVECVGKAGKGWIYEKEVEPAPPEVLAALDNYLALIKRGDVAQMQAKQAFTRADSTAIYMASQALSDQALQAAILAEEKQQTELQKKTEFNTRMILIVQVIGVAIAVITSVCARKL